MWTVTFKRENSKTIWSYWVDGENHSQALQNALREAKKYTTDKLTLISIRDERSEVWEP